MKRIPRWCAVSVLFVAALAPAQITYDGLRIPPTHPRLLGLGNSTVLANARAWLNAHPVTPPQPCALDAGGHAVVWEQLSCQDIALKHAIRGTDCSAAITWAVNVAQNYTHFVGVLDLGNSINDLGTGPPMIYDFCYDQMTATQRSDFAAGWDNWIQKGITTYSGNGQGCVNGLEGNLCWGSAAAGFVWGVAGYGDDTSNAQAGFTVFDNTWAAFKKHVATDTMTLSGITVPGGTGGVFQEGLNYGKLVTGDMAMVFATAKGLGRDLSSETSWFTAVPYALLYNLPPTPTYTHQHNATCWDAFPWNEGHLNCTSEDFLSETPPGATDVASVLSQEFAGTNAGGYLQTWLNTLAKQLPPDPWFAAVDSGASNTPLPYSTLPLDYYARGPGFFWARHAWDTSSAIAWFGLNTPSEVTGHVDPVAGTWQIWRGARWLSRISTEYGSPGLTEWGGTGSTGSNNDTTYAQNGLLINPDNEGCTPGKDCNKQNGGEIAGSLAVQNGPPQVGVLSPAIASRVESRSGYSYAAVDISGAYSWHAGYPQYNNPAVDTVVREYVWVRDLETLVIFDRIRTNPVGPVPAGNIKRTFLAHCEVPWNLTSANTANCQPGNRQELFLTTLLPKSPNPAFVDVSEASCCRDQDAQYRLEVNDTPGMAQSYFAHVLQAGNTTTMPLKPTITDNGSSYIITLDANHSITFVKGSKSSGGSITIDGATTEFTTTVAPERISTDGVIWGSHAVEGGQIMGAGRKAR